MSDNSSDGGYGGGVYAAGSTIAIARSTITENTATGAGGAVYISDSSLTLADTNMADNSSDGYGAASTRPAPRSTSPARRSPEHRDRGGRRLQLELVAHARRFTRDPQRLRWLRGRRLRAGSTIAINSSRMTNNAATAAGGAVYSSNSSLTLAATRVSSNDSDGYGGASTPPAPGSRSPTAISPITRPALRAAASTPITAG